MRETLTNLKVEDFAHPEDLQAIRNVEKLKPLSWITSRIEDVGNQLYYQTNALGSCVRLTEETDPHHYYILKDICKILDYPTVPDLYSTRSYSTDIQLSGETKPIMVVSDFILNNYDDDLLYFKFGRAITRMKSGHLKLYVAVNTLMTVTGAGVSDSVKLAMANWMRKSELTADRGGLLACQSIRSAMTVLMNVAGMPIHEAQKVDYGTYISECKDKTDPALVKLGKNLQTFTNCTGWANDRILELFLWYSGGAYGDLLDKYAD